MKEIIGRLYVLFGLLLLGFGLLACSSQSAVINESEGITAVADTTTPASTSDDPRPEGWSEESHSNNADLNYDIVFPSDKVNQITITISPEDWQAMQDNMVELAGEPTGDGGMFGGQAFNNGEGGEGGNRPMPPGFEGTFEEGEFPELPEESQFEPGQMPPTFEGAAGQGQGFPGGGNMQGGGFGGGDFLSENPMWVESTITFNGQEWTHVGVRYKGNSSLRSAWQSGSLKMPFKLDFDEFEDDYPEVLNQRFYGFKQLSLANGFGDATYMRDVISYELYEDAGLVASATAHYEVILDYGQGPVSLGIYTVIEVTDDTVIEEYFGDDSGNIYEGNGSAASFSEGTFSQISESFEKKNNKKEADWSDIEALYEYLHDPLRLEDPEQWRAGLEELFDVDTFLNWLAVSALLQHWDTYGGMAHNYYIYHDPDSDQLTWISWDHNLVLGASIGGGGGGQRGQGGFAPGGGGGANAGGGFGGGMNSITLDRSNINEQWPLIRYLLDDPVYEALYYDYMETAVETFFTPEKLTARYEEMAELLAPYVAAESGDNGAFNTAVQSLISVTNSQYRAAVELLATH